MAQTRIQNISKEAFQPGAVKTCTAVGAITGKRFVKIVSGGTAFQPKVSVCTAATDRPWGIAEHDAAAGSAISVNRIGAFSVTAGAAAVTGGSEVQTDATGKAVVLASGKSAGVLLHDVAAGGDAYITLTV